VIVGATAPALALLLAAGCHIPAAPGVSLPKAVPADTEAGQFAGNEACAECHKAEFDLHRKSNHALTLRRADAANLGPLAPQAGPIAGTPYAITEQAGNFQFTGNDPLSASGTIQFALGSGKTVMTYVGDLGVNRMTEFRWSFVPHERTWCVTPGQQRLSNHKLGVVNELTKPRRCLLCHSVAVKPSGSEPAPGFLGVGCESCHGPGGAHIAAVKAAGAKDIKMDRMGTWGAARLDAMCARCHRGTDDLSLSALESNSTARFQPYGLEMSPCFKKSGDKLSCITCHNPHANASTDRHEYEKVCLSCHSAAGSTHNKTCPVNPKEKCVGCHMPKEPVFAGTNIPVSMADHLIWASRKPK
jgi:predicted CXXCH cytochrome family protein